MTTKDLLTEYLERERNNVFCYSANYLMDTPKRGYEREFRETQERVELLEELLRTFLNKTSMTNLDVCAMHVEGYERKE